MLNDFLKVAYHAVLLLYFLLTVVPDWQQWRVRMLPVTHQRTIRKPELETKYPVEMKLPGRGHSSPVTAGRNIWVTTALEPGLEKRKDETKENDGLPSVTVLSKVSLHALQIDPNSGGVQQNIKVFEKKQP